MMTQTPPRESAAMSRKRNRRNEAHAAASFPPAHRADAASAVGASDPIHHDRDADATCPSLFSPSLHKNYHDNAAAEAATVSPFVDRLAQTKINQHNNNALFSSPLFQLEPVQEETTADNNNNNNFSLSQTSIASSLTLDSNAASAASDSSVRMDYWSGSGSIGDIHSVGGGNGNNHPMIGNMVGGTVESVAGCSVGGVPSSISSESHDANDRMGSHQPFHMQECLPPMKRARLDYVPEQMMDEDMASSPPLSYMLKMGPNGINLKTNVDNTDGRVCCHVCSAAETANHKNGRIASNSRHFQPGRAAAADDAASAPRSHSLLAYFQCTARKQTAPHEPPKFHHQREDSPKDGVAVPSNLSQCRYCDKPTCVTCTRQCERCQHPFCIFCTKVDYESSVVERIMCFECDEYTTNKEDDRGCEMMDL